MLVESASPYFCWACAQRYVLQDDDGAGEMVSDSDGEAESVPHWVDAFVAQPMRPNAKKRRSFLEQICFASQTRLCQFPPGLGKRQE